MQATVIKERSKRRSIAIVQHLQVGTVLLGIQISYHMWQLAQRAQLVAWAAACPSLALRAGHSVSHDVCDSSNSGFSLATLEEAPRLRSHAAESSKLVVVCQRARCPITVTVCHKWLGSGPFDRPLPQLNVPRSTRSLHPTSLSCRWQQ